MGTISPTVVDAFRLLRLDLYGHLDQAEFLADKLNEWSAQDEDTVRELIPDLLFVIRRLLVEHEVLTNGDCRICTSAWPCPVVTTIHAQVKDPQHQFVSLVRRARDEE
ncbi:MAG: hypothetical protein ACRDT0_04265 [Pseudonocardiaceae bacterium]